MLLSCGVTDASIAPDPEETQEGEEESHEVPSGLEKWAVDGPI